jgi:hypothetical protein
MVRKVDWRPSGNQSPARLTVNADFQRARIPRGQDGGLFLEAL